VALPQERLIECPHKITEGQLALRAIDAIGQAADGGDLRHRCARLRCVDRGPSTRHLPCRADLSIAGINDAEIRTASDAPRSLPCGCRRTRSGTRAPPNTCSAASTRCPRVSATQVSGQPDRARPATAPAAGCITEAATCRRDRRRRCPRSFHANIRLFDDTDPAFRVRLDEAGEVLRAVVRGRLVARRFQPACAGSASSSPRASAEN